MRLFTRTVAGIVEVDATGKALGKELEEHDGVG